MITGDAVAESFAPLSSYPNYTYNIIRTEESLYRRKVTDDDDDDDDALKSPNDDGLQDAT